MTKYSQLAVLIALLALFAPLYSQHPERDPADEQKIYAELKTSALIEKFKLGTEALDGGDYEIAIKNYNEVLKTAPKFGPALRRLGYALVGVGKRAEGIASVEKALEGDRTWANLLGMAQVLVTSSDPNFKASKAELDRAYVLLSEATNIQPQPEPDALALVAQVSLELDRPADFLRMAERLNKEFPDTLQQRYFNSIKLADEGKFDAAVSEVRAAQGLGLSYAEADRMVEAIRKVEAENYPFTPYRWYLYAFMGIVALWVLGLLALYLLGRRFSARTLQTLEDSDPNDVTGGGHASLKYAYRRLITFAGIYYYVSQPIVIAVVVVATAGLIYGSFVVGRIPVLFLLGLVFVGAWSIYSLLKSMVFRPKAEDPGRILTENEAPKLWELVRQVGGDVNTRTIDEIRITPGSELAVYERGSFRKKMKDQADRVLILGVASFNGFSTNAFRAVLAHEYGHFSNRDTAGGDIAFRVNTDMIRTAETIVASGANTYHNLAFHFLRIYHFIFRRITHGSSRLQEVLADRVAVHRYGAAAFREGLEHVIRQEIAFNAVADHEVNVALSQHRPINNIYFLSVSDEQTLTDIERETQEILNAPTTEDDTHPSPIDRFRHAEKITSQTAADVKGQVWDLFEDRDGMTQSMSEFLEESVRAIRYGSDHNVLSS